jgi:uncharacterized delta-60 repeat protein
MWFLFSRKTRSSKKPSRVSPSRRPRLEVLEDRCLLSAGALDPTFGNGAGYVTTSLTNATGMGGQTILLQPDGKSMDVGFANFAKNGKFQGSDFAAVRYNADGTLDKSFGSAGVALISPPSISSGSSMSGVGAALYPSAGTPNDGKILVEASYPVTQGENQIPIDELALVRLNSNGTVDTTFGSAGEVLTFFSVGGTKVGVHWAGVVVTSRGQILKCGETSTGTALARFKDDGTLDTTFGQGGKVITPGPEAQNVIQLSNGQLLAGGWEGNSGTVARYNANGTLDPTFGSGGVTTNSAFGGGGVLGVAVYPAAEPANDGKIVVAGNGGPNLGWEVARYNPNGTLDSTFGSGGMVHTLTGLTYARSVAIQPDGKVVVAGDGSILERYNADGSLDATFGTGGIETTTVPATSLTSLVIQTDGDIVSAGQGSTFLLARFLPSEPEISSFTSSAPTVTSGSSVTLTASGITDGNPSSTIKQVTFYYIDSSGTQHVLGMGTQGGGVWTLNYTVSLVPGTYTVYAQAEDNYNVLGDPLALTLTV